MTQGSGSLRNAAALAVDFVRQRPLMNAFYGVLLFVQTILQGIGLLLLVPILATVGVDPGKHVYDGDRPVPLTDRGKPIRALFS